MKNSTHNIPVLIVGGGPVGLSMALCLARQNIPSLIVEKHSGRTPHPRARGVSMRTMELFRQKLKDFDPLSKILHENLIGGYTRAATKCYFIQLDPKVRCPDYVIGHATMKTGTPRTKICTAAKRAATAPRGCQRKHCTPCSYDNI